MRNLPRAIIHVLRQCNLLFNERFGEWAKILLVGAILAPGKRTVTAVLRVMGLRDERQFQNYYRVLNHAVWSPRAVSRALLRLLVSAFSLEGSQSGIRPCPRPSFEALESHPCFHPFRPYPPKSAGLATVWLHDISIYNPACADQESGSSTERPSRRATRSVIFALFSSLKASLPTQRAVRESDA